MARWHDRSPGRTQELPLPEAAPTPSVVRLLVSELKRRGVLRVAAIYLVAAWAAIQVSDTTFPALGLPQEWITAVVIAALIGFPVAVGGAWFFDLHRDARDVAPSATPVLSTSQARLTILAAIALGTTVLMTVAWFTLRAPPAAASGDGAPPNHIAVLYLDDRTADPSLSYLAATLTETLTTELAQVSGLRLISSNGVRAYQDAGVTLDSLGRALGVGTLVAGSVSAAGDTVRVAVQLVDPRTGVVENARTHQRHRGDAVGLVDELVRDIAGQLRPVIGQRVAVRRFQAGTGSAEAWSLVQRARQLQVQARDLQAVGGTAGAERTLAEADSLLARAEEEDARYVDAIVERAAVARGRAFVALAAGPAGPVRALEFIDGGIAHASRALQRDARAAGALEYRGALLDLRLTFAAPADSIGRTQLMAEAERDLRAAVAIDSTRARAYSTLSSLLESQAQFAEARLMAERAHDADAYLENAPELLNRLFITSFELGDDAVASRRCAEIRRREGLRFEGAMCELMLRAWSPTLAPDIDAAWHAVAAGTAGMPPGRLAWQRPHLEVLAAAVIAGARDADSARAVLTRAESAAPDDHEVLQLAAGAWLLLGDEARAQQRLDRYTAMLGYLPPQVAASRRFAGLRHAR